jgi:hypothetical protein
MNEAIGEDVKQQPGGGAKIKGKETGKKNFFFLVDFLCSLSFI